MASKKDLDIVLVQPGDRKRIYQSLGPLLSAVEPPIWAGLMATFLRNQGISVRILDANAENLTPDEAASRVVEMNPILAAVVVYGQNPSASTQVMPAAGEVCKSLKDLDPTIKVLMVGGHVAALPEGTLREEKVDFVCGGEGPYTLHGLIQALKSPGTDFRHVRGLYYWEQKSLRINPPAPLVCDLDREMPGVAWDLLPMAKYRAHNWHCFGNLERQPYAALYTTLGCPYHCAFCCIQAPFRAGEELAGYKMGRNSYRYWAPKRVIAQIDTLVTKFGVRNIKFADEIFVLNSRHVEEICGWIIDRGYDLNIWAYARVDRMSEALAEKLKRAGFHWLGFGVEAARDETRQDVSKGFQAEKIHATFAQMRRVDISVGANYIFGLPEDNLEGMQETLDLAVGLNTEWANFNCAMAYPGSRLYEMALEKKWPLPENWGGYAQHAEDTLPLPTRYLPGSEVLRFRDRAFDDYFHRPEYLHMMTRKFGQPTVQQIQEILAHKLVRKNG